ncbi:MAG: ABC transporter permease [Phycisphaerales bacterium]
MILKRVVRTEIMLLIVPMSLIVGWECIVRLELVPPSQAAAPSAVIVCLASLLAKGTLLKHACYSMGRIAAGVLIGSSIGVSSGVFLGTSRTADRLFSPTVQLLAGVPVVVWIPFWVMFFGTDEAFKIAMAAISTFFLVHLNTFGGVRSTGRHYLELADIYEKGAWEKIREILLPSAAPAILNSIRMSLILCWVVIFFVEYASARHGAEGLGWFIADSRQVGKIEEEFAGLLFLGLIAYFSDRLLSAVQRRALSWSDTLETAILQEERL